MNTLTVIFLSVIMYGLYFFDGYFSYLIEKRRDIK